MIYFHFQISEKKFKLYQDSKYSKYYDKLDKKILKKAKKWKNIVYSDLCKPTYAVIAAYFRLQELLDSGKTIPTYSSLSDKYTFLKNDFIDSSLSLTLPTESAFKSQVELTKQGM